MPNSNPGPLPQKSGALAMSHHISSHVPLGVQISIFCKLCKNTEQFMFKLQAVKNMCVLYAHLPVLLGF